ALFCCIERAFRSEGSNMQFVNDSFFPGTSTPLFILPVESGGIDYLARSMNIGTLKTRGWIWDLGLAIDLKLVSATCRGVGDKFEPPVFKFGKGSRLLIGEAEVDSPRFRSPETESYVSVIEALRPEGHRMFTPHAGAPPPARGRVPAQPAKPGSGLPTRNLSPAHRDVPGFLRFGGRCPQIPPSLRP